MTMKNRYRRTIRDASLSPPKFISFADFIKQRRKPVAKKESKPVKPTSSTAGVLPEMKKLEDLDLEKITDLRKEALNGIDSTAIKEMGKWGSTKTSEKKAEPPRKVQQRSQRNEITQKPTRNTESKPVQVVETKQKAKLIDMTHNSTLRGILFVWIGCRNNVYASD